MERFSFACCDLKDVSSLFRTVNERTWYFVTFVVSSITQLCVNIFRYFEILRGDPLPNLDIETPVAKDGISCALRSGLFPYQWLIF